LPGGDPIGRTFLARVPGSAENIALEVVGIVRDAQVSALGEANPYSVYMPGGDVALLVRSRTDSGATASAIHAAVRSLDPELVVRVIPLEANLAWWRGVSGMVTTLGAGLGALALVLASVGIYGIVGYTVSRRYREIGIRMALGAQASDVLGMILRQTMRPVVVGALVGVVAAIALSRILSSFLFGVSPADPIGLGGAVLLVMGVALIAGIVAARRGTWVNPTTTLHYE
jgi:ABC-type antimicrobial peptide transport system permease subunit